MAGRAKLLLRQYRPLMIILVITVAIWMAWAMSESQSYSTRVRVEFVGIDTARYAIVSRDSVVSLDITANGYNTLSRYFDSKRRVVSIDMRKGHLMPNRASISMTAVIDEVRRQFDIPISTPVSSRIDSLRVYYSPRIKKGFVPKLAHVDISFSDGFGLNGQPYMLEDTIWLYGSRESLSRISSLETAPARYSNLHATDTLILPLNPVWERYPDLHVSSGSVSLVVPTSAYAEHVFSLPVHTSAADTSMQIKLYPENVKVWALTPILDNYEPLSEDQLRCSISINMNDDHAKVHVSRFPSYVRIKKIEPETIQYVIIK